jgi:hypothetical protein
MPIEKVRGCKSISLYQPLPKLSMGLCQLAKLESSYSDLKKYRYFLNIGTWGAEKRTQGVLTGGIDTRGEVTGALHRERRPG